MNNNQEILKHADDYQQRWRLKANLEEAFSIVLKSELAKLPNGVKRIRMTYHPIRDFGDIAAKTLCRSFGGKKDHSKRH